MKRVAIVQSNYIPWRGYFDLINRVDEFVLLDEVQFTRRDWRNRNLIKTPQGAKWLTIPVASKGQYLQKISEVRVEDASWAEKHWKSIIHAYSKAPYFSRYENWLKALYENAAQETCLSAINRLFLEAICREIGINTVLSNSSDYALEGAKTERLLSICVQAEANCYLSGPAAKDYLEEKQFQEQGITVNWMDYADYPDYFQLHGDFDGKVSIVDLLMNVGPDARDYMLSFDTTSKA